MLKATGIIIIAIVLLQGCSVSPLQQQTQASVTSSPSGATVYANSLELGKTPLKYNLFDAFPAGWKNMTYQAQGILLVKMDGCKDYSTMVNDYILSKPIHVELICSTVIDAKDPKTTVDLPVEPATPVSTNETIENRLKKLEELYKKGVITENEYQSTRTRILSEL